jgi:hypothetical protein
VVTTARQVGGTLGIAVMGAIVAASETVASADPRFPLQFMDGFHNALEAAALITFVGAVAAAALVRRVVPPEPAGTVGSPREPAGRRHPRPRVRSDP